LGLWLLSDLLRQLGLWRLLDLLHQLDQLRLWGRHLLEYLVDL
jgi:hypothetical protein